MKKRIMSVLLALVMALSLCTVALADPTDGAGGTATAAEIYEFKLNFYYYGGEVTGISVDITSPIGFVNTDKGLYMYDDDNYNYYELTNGWIDDTTEYYLGVTFEANDTNGAIITTNPDKNNLTLNVVKYNSDGTAVGDGTTLLNASPITAKDCQYDQDTDSITAYFPLPHPTVADYTKSIPLTKNVNQAGNVAPGMTTFELDILAAYDTADDQDPADFVTVSSTFTFGDGSTPAITVTGPKAMVDAFLDEGFFVREKAHSDTRWTCDTTMWFVEDNHVWGVDGNGSIACTEIAEWGAKPECEYSQESQSVNHQSHFNGVSFTNTYTANRTTHHTPTPTPTEKIEAPKTFDAGIAVYGVMAVSSLFGMGYVGKKKF